MARQRRRGAAGTVAGRAKLSGAPKGVECGSGRYWQQTVRSVFVLPRLWRLGLARLPCC